MLERELRRLMLIKFLQWNDSNGCYTDEDCDLEKVSRLTYEEAMKYFFGLINDDFYYSVVDNIFELTYEEIIEYAKQNNFYESTMKKLNLLINEPNPTEIFYKSLL